VEIKHVTVNRDRSHLTAFWSSSILNGFAQMVHDSPPAPGGAAAPGSRRHSGTAASPDVADNDDADVVRGGGEASPQLSASVAAAAAHARAEALLRAPPPQLPLPAGGGLSLYSHLPSSQVAALQRKASMLSGIIILFNKRFLMVTKVVMA
jgi:hypothetical protein